MNTHAEPAADRRTALGAFITAAAAFALPAACAGEAHSPVDTGGPWFSAFGLKMKVEVTTASTGGAMSATRVISQAGGGPPAHIHTREDEVFLILRGHYRFWQEGMPTIEAPAGTVLLQHKGMVHQYRNVSDQEGEHILICMPGGLEDLFSQVAQEGLVVPQDMTRIVDLSARYGLTYRPSIAK